MLEIFSVALAWAMRHTDICNAISAATVLLVGIGLLFANRDALRQRPWMRHALGFWLVQWVVFGIIYWYIHANHTGLPGLWLLPLVDLQSTFAVGFFIAFLYGRAYEPGTAWISLAILFGTLLVVGLWVGSEAVNSAAGSQWRYAWVALSEVISATALVAMGGVFMFRYGLIALPSLVTNVVYAALQRPIYAGLFVSLNPQPKWFLTVALGKLLVAYFFYAYFFAFLESYEPLALPSPKPEVEKIVSKRLLLMLRAVKVWEFFKKT